MFVSNCVHVPHDLVTRTTPHAFEKKLLVPPKLTNLEKVLFQCGNQAVHSSQMRGTQVVIVIPKLMVGVSHEQNTDLARIETLDMRSLVEDLSTFVDSPVRMHHVVIPYVITVFRFHMLIFNSLRICFSQVSGVLQYYRMVVSVKHETFLLGGNRSPGVSFDQLMLVDDLAPDLVCNECR